MFIGSPGDRFSYRVAGVVSFNYVTFIWLLGSLISLELAKIKIHEKNYRLHTFEDGAFNIKVISLLKLFVF
jgi:hypothetical protein